MRLFLRALLFWHWSLLLLFDPESDGELLEDLSSDLLLSLLASRGGSWAERLQVDRLVLLKLVRPLDLKVCFPVNLQPDWVIPVLALLLLLFLLLLLLFLRLLVLLHILFGSLLLVILSHVALLLFLLLLIFCKNLGNDLLSGLLEFFRISVQEPDLILLDELEEGLEPQFRDLSCELWNLLLRVISLRELLVEPVSLRLYWNLFQVPEEGPDKEGLI